MYKYSSRFMADRMCEDENVKGKKKNVIDRSQNDHSHSSIKVAIRSRESAHDPTDEPGVVPVGQMIPSTGPMAADRRRSVAWMMTTMTADLLLLHAEGRGAQLNCRDSRCDTRNARRKNTRSGRVGVGDEEGEEQRTRPSAVDWRKRPARWSVANWLGLTPRVATASCETRRAETPPSAACGIGCRCRCGCATDLIAADLSAIGGAPQRSGTRVTRVSLAPLSSSSRTGFDVRRGRIARRPRRAREQIQT
ncbi:hypothetical protein ALC57_03634 [Trachymyrmex cornetzi]|uniref:Uncharacterized protein n=1 Tax=Trachymyrmex cornetzi TaxID=471704 RepID=A0A195EGA9_9HYME|nr:hypothetical protein ALC57_03634 [Trachymyrmex cornetzi]